MTDKLLLLNTFTSRVATGNTTVDLVMSTGVVRLDPTNRRAYIKDLRHTVGLTDEYTDHQEIVRELCVIVLRELCCNHGYALYRSDL